MPHKPTAAATRTLKSGLTPRDMRRNDPWAITAHVDTTFRSPTEEGYIERTNEDRYGHLIGREHDEGRHHG